LTRTNTLASARVDAAKNTKETAATKAARMERCMASPSQTPLGCDIIVVG
jgi:hypothetical protein